MATYPATISSIKFSSSLLTDKDPLIAKTPTHSFLSRTSIRRGIHLYPSSSILTSSSNDFFIIDKSSISSDDCTFCENTSFFSSSLYTARPSSEIGISSFISSKMSSVIFVVTSSGLRILRKDEVKSFLFISRICSRLYLYISI